MPRPGRIVGYELGKVKDDGLERRFQVLRPAHALLEAARNLSPEKWMHSIKVDRPDGSSNRIIPKVHFGVVASGEKVVADTSLVSELQSHWSKLIAVEMEAYGTALAAYQAETVPGMLIIKSLCDWADPSKNDEWQEYAADAAATFTIALLKTEPFESRPKTQAAKKAPASFDGRIKIILCRRMSDDWQDLADYFVIPPHHKKRFEKGRECQGVWEWLEARNKLDGLKEALKFLDRDDLVELLV